METLSKTAFVADSVIVNSLARIRKEVKNDERIDAILAEIETVDDIKRAVAHLVAANDHNRTERQEMLIFIDELVGLLNYVSAGAAIPKAG